MFSAARICGLSSTKMSESEDKFHSSHTEYEHAVNTLNLLQYKSKSQLVGDKPSEVKPRKNKLQETVKYLKRCGIELDNLDLLSVIHVAGTKGKGSTCALTESILRSFGMRTGFFSSPHLISVTERIRIDGQPLSQQSFTKYFWEGYNKLIDQQNNPSDMPGYFQFLTILSFYVFIKEKVDVAIIEVGIGGENDCTNVLRNTKTVGITSLGLEHTNLLGNTLEQIAWHKAGIIKETSHTFTVRQPDECMEVLKTRAAEKNASLKIVRQFTDYNWVKLPKLQIENKIQSLNASLAMELSYDWIRNNRSDLLADFAATDLEINTGNKIYKGLEECFWPGRCQYIEYKNLHIFLDGAHTVESIDICIDWFMGKTNSTTNPKILIFNATGTRDSLNLLKILKARLSFSKAYFVPNIPFINSEQTNPDIITFVPNREKILRTTAHSELWYGNTGAESCFPCITDVFYSIKREFPDLSVIEILVTGSIHLIGATMLAIEHYDKEQQPIV